MSLEIQLNKDIISSAAVNLNWNLNKLHSSVSIICNDGKKINGKSLLAILKSYLMKDDIITVILEDITEINMLKQYLSEVGREV